MKTPLHADDLLYSLSLMHFVNYHLSPEAILVVSFEAQHHSGFAALSPPGPPDTNVGAIRRFLVSFSPDAASRSRLLGTLVEELTMAAGAFDVLCMPSM